jgi:hypothetical protein
LSHRPNCHGPGSGAVQTAAPSNELPTQSVGAACAAVMAPRHDSASAAQRFFIFGMDEGMEITV